ncbi:hypothetical protein AVDCRST_MAG94-6175 [uncultured Leptolyngbya sp.]|uniref:Uncharacterized protein n=1 Tax=uncultured Leptolyngbya sp. TaxID=332963 RepID=A0A6J4P4U6_9CYAN|nr:hypothetical protein AVDCRST_MAG94-6175 [uncultured Leptolyngbya sp.]
MLRRSDRTATADPSDSFYPIFGTHYSNLSLDANQCGKISQFASALNFTRLKLIPFRFAWI